MLGCDFAKRAAALVADLLETLRDALIEHYAVQRELGRGGMATVFLAEDRKHHRPVAIKVLHSELAAALGSDRFLREIAIAARLQHPHILPLYDSGTDRKSTRLNSSHGYISYAVFCLKKKKQIQALYLHSQYTTPLTCS